MSESSGVPVLLLLSVALLAGGVLGVLLGWVLRGPALARLEPEAARAAILEAALDVARKQADQHARGEAEARGRLARLATVEAELDRVREQHAALAAEHARLETASAKDRENAAVRLAELSTLRDEMQARLRAVAAEALAGNQDRFLELADQVLARHKQEAVHDLDRRHKAIEGLVGPVAATLAEYRTGLSRFEAERTTQFATLQAEVANLLRAQGEARQETGRLVQALRAAPKTRGRWGEQQLRNVLELAGMTHHVDFEVETTFHRDEAALRPDVVIRMPGERFLVVDAKTSLHAYLEAVDTADEAIREECLVRHAKQIRTHMLSLADKRYWDRLTVTPDFVAMFIPGDSFFAAAMERDGALFEDALARRVLIVTPTTLVALAKAIALGWRQEKLADDSRHILTLAQELYKRLSAMGGHVVELGKRLESASKAYNALVGSLEGSVMPQARRFQDLNVPGTQAALAMLVPTETELRQPRPDRDMELAGPN